MPSFLEITADKLARIIGIPNAPTIIDVRIDDDFGIDPRRIPEEAGWRNLPLFGAADSLGRPLHLGAPERTAMAH